ncbi:MAG TPA: AbiV family abortive infection protein [Bacteroidales bacterium]|nr:AbiV family abortive infection protein [Bacteroidales bacterium]
MSKTFLTISKKECLSVYRDILENSEKKWTAASKLAEIGEFGSATSMAIISVEELIKALILFFDGKGFDFRSIKGINVIFRNHKVRYFIAFAMFVVSVLGDDLLKFISEIRKNPKKLVTLLDKLKALHGYIEDYLKPYVEKKIGVFKEEFIWFSNVDIFRQDGFYCDYKEQLKNPIKITNEDYLKVIQRLERVRKIGIVFIDSFNLEDEHTVSQLKITRHDFKRKKIYYQIGEALNLLRETKLSPFDLARQCFNYI